jgi:antibiotic biosynthesis monooxygenase (ABM) superfamily enzyme
MPADEEWFYARATSSVQARFKPMIAALILAYVLVCLLTGFCGTHRRMGYWGTFFFSLLATPLVVLLVLFITGPSRHVEWRRRNIE